MDPLFLPEINILDFDRTLVVTLSLNLYISSILLQQCFLIVLFSLAFDPASTTPSFKQKDSDRDFILTFMGDQSKKSAARGHNSVGLTSKKHWKFQPRRCCTLPFSWLILLWQKKIKQNLVYFLCLPWSRVKSRGKWRSHGCEQEKWFTWLFSFGVTRGYLHTRSSQNMISWRNIYLGNFLQLKTWKYRFAHAPVLVREIPLL